MIKFLKLVTAAIFLVTVSGCTALTTAIDKRNLETSTQMSSTVFLDPVSDSKKVVYLQVRNSSDKGDYNIRGALEAQLTNRGYTVTTSVDRAHYMIQANILSVGKMKPEAAAQTLRSGYGGVLVGAAAAYVAKGSGRGIVVGGIAGAAAEWAGNLLVKDISFSSITDLQISERSRGSVKATSKHTLQQGNSGKTTEYYEENRNWRRYQTRIVSSANKANLKWEEARPELIKGLAQSISGMF